MLKPNVIFKNLYFSPKKIKSDKKGQGNLIALILASVIGTLLIGSVTQWYLSMKNNIKNNAGNLEAMTIAMNEWQRLEHMSLDELEASREDYKNPYDVGDKYKVKVELGKQGYFANGKCNALEGEFASESPNCMQDTVMNIYDKETDKLLYTTRSLPISSGTTGASGVYNQMLTITEDQVFTASEKGWYKITAIGGGGGGNGGSCMVSNWAWASGGGGGGGGGKYIGYHYLEKGDTVNITIGKGGSGANGVVSYSGTCASSAGKKGENTIVEIKGTSYVAYGGGGAWGSCTSGHGGEGGAGTIKGDNGNNSAMVTDYVIPSSGMATKPGLGGGHGYGEGGMGGNSCFNYNRCTFSTRGQDGKSGVTFIEFYSKKAK